MSRVLKLQWAFGKVPQVLSSHQPGHCRAPSDTKFAHRQLMQSGGLSVEDGLEMRNLLSFPGGLELHIGVRSRHSHEGIFVGN